MIERRQFLVGAGIAALFPQAKASAKALQPSPPSPPLLASNALALLRG